MQRAATIAVAVLLCSVLLSPVGRELFVGDETKYSQVVREMRSAEGSWLLPTLNGSPFTHKPPLHFWAVASLTVPLGVYSIWPFVLPSIVAFALLMLLMWRMGGPFAAFLCGTSLLMWGSAQTARMDVAFAALLALSAWLIRRSFEGERTLFGAAVAAGLAFLVKGPMAPVIAAALYLFEAIRRRRDPSWTARPGASRLVLALLVMLAIPLLWLIPAIVTGGEPYFREIFFKQTVGRAVGAWVHKSPPWFYLVRAPLTLAPWFFLTVVAFVAAWRRNDERAKFAVSWLLAVLVPYTLLSSKLDVYMITLQPAVALLNARLVEGAADRFSDWGRRANLVMLTLFGIIGAAGLLVQPSQIRDAQGALVALPAVRALFAILLGAALFAAVATLRGRLGTSVIATGFVPVAAFAWAAVALLPLANEQASTRPLVAAIERSGVAPESVGLYMCPHVWVRGMDPQIWRARHLEREEVASARPEVLVVRRKNAEQIADVLSQYRKVDELVMIGKPFDVYRR